MRHLSSLLLALPLAACQSTGDDAPSGDPIVDDVTNAAEAAMELPPGVTAEMMQSFMEAATPGEEHRALDGMVGKFDVEHTMWMAPGAEPMVSTGTNEASWDMDGKFVTGSLTGSWNGMPFNGKVWMGYDKVRNQYRTAWIDNMGTQMMNIATGELKPDGTIEYVIEDIDPMTRQPLSMRAVVTYTDDGYLYDMYMPNPEGGEFHSLRTKYTRAD